MVGDVKWLSMVVAVAVAVATVSLAACSPAPPEAIPAAGAPSATQPATAVSDAPIASPVSSTPASPPSEPPTSAPPSSAPPVAPETPKASISETPASATPPATPGKSGTYTTADVQAWVEAPAAAPGKLVFLTFDDGPNHSISPLVLDALKAADVHATFFIVGNEVPRAPDVLQREVDEGHTIALHSLTHDYKKLYPGRKANAERVAWEFDETMRAVRAVLGDDFSTSAWRYPGGHISWTNMASSDAALEARGATWLDWNAMTGDAEPKKRRPTTVDAMVALATKPITDDVKVVVLLAHDSRGKDLTVASLPRIIDAYKAAGYGFGTLS